MEGNALLHELFGTKERANMVSMGEEFCSSRRSSHGVDGVMGCLTGGEAKYRSISTVGDVRVVARAVVREQSEGPQEAGRNRYRSTMLLTTLRSGHASQISRSTASLCRCSEIRYTTGSEMIGMGNFHALAGSLAGCTLCAKPHIGRDTMHNAVI